MSKYIITVLHISYYIDMNNEAYTGICGLGMLASKLTVDILDQCTNSVRCDEYISCISECVRVELRASECILSILLDVSTDKCTFYVKCLHAGKVEESFLTIAPFENDFLDIDS